MRRARDEPSIWRHAWMFVATVLLVGMVASGMAMDGSATRTAPGRWKVVDLGVDLGVAVGVDDRGEVVGLRGDDVGDAFLWRNGRVTDLGNLGGGSSRPVAIDARGEVVGSSVVKGSKFEHAFLWRRGKMLDLGTLGGRWSNAVAVNERGQIAGNGETSDRHSEHAFLWQDGRMVDLGTLGGDFAEAFAINDRGQIVGWSDTKGKQRHAFLWQKGKMRDLGTSNGLWARPTAINDQGQIVGYTTTPIGNTGTAFAWQNGKMTDLGKLGRGGSSEAIGVNARGQTVVNRFPPTVNPHGIAFLLHAGQTTNLGSLGGGITRATGISDRGQVIGISYTFKGSAARPFVWENGRMTALGTLDGWGPPFTTPVAINNHNQIVGDSYRRSGAHGILWTRTRN